MSRTGKKPSRLSGYTKISFLLTEGGLSELHGIARAQGISLVEMLRRALSLFRFLMREVRKGNKVFIGRDGEPIYEVILPCAETSPEEP